MFNALSTKDAPEKQVPTDRPETPIRWFRFPSAVIVVYSFCATTFFGAMLFDLVVLYPNVFADIPASLELTSEYLTAANPGTLFPRVGQATLLAGVVAVAFNWRVPGARNLLLLSLAVLFGGTYLITEFFFNRRNEILFLEGVARHSVADLRATAREFLLVNWVRVAVVFVAPWLVQAALLIAHTSAALRELERQPEPVQVGGEDRV